MHTIYAEDADDALSQGLEHLLGSGVVEQSRNGPVIVAPQPVAITYANPRRRVIRSSIRDQNCFFTFFESLWMLAGRNDVKFPSYFNSTYGQFSDDGVTMWDAYGWRWRSFFGYDQLACIADELRVSPTSRRCVLSMWNSKSLEPPAHDDLFTAVNGGKAVPCNTQAYFDVRGGKLNMTVTNRSNDAIWGCFGANQVHFSFLLEYMAMLISVPIGVYHQFTNNLHVYTDKFDRTKLSLIAYESKKLRSSPDRPSSTGNMIEAGFDEDLAVFMQWADKLIDSTVSVAPPPTLTTQFMRNVAVPMLLTWYYRKQKDTYSMHRCLNEIDAPDWRAACKEWMGRRDK